MSAPTSEHSESEFYSIPKTLNELLDHVSHACESGVHLYGGVLGTTIGIEAVIGRLRQDREYPWGIEVAGKGPYLLSVTSPEEDSETAKAFIWQNPETGIIHLLSGQDRGSFERLVKKVHRYLYPELFRIGFRTADVLRILNAVVRQPGCGPIRIREYVARSLIDDPVASKRVDTIRRWTDESHETVFQTLAENGQWLSAFRFEMHASTEVAARVWRDGSYVCERGFRVFRAKMLQLYEKRMLDSERFYQYRDRQSSPTHSSRPVTLSYRRNVFENKRENYRLIEVVKNLPDCSVAVVHPNPYVHVSVLDYMDGSNYDIWVTTSDSVMIIPREKATGQSVQKACDHICELFEEGEVMEYRFS